MGLIANTHTLSSHSASPPPSRTTSKVHAARRAARIAQTGAGITPVTASGTRARAEASGSGTAPRAASLKTPALRRPSLHLPCPSESPPVPRCDRHQGPRAASLADFCTSHLSPSDAARHHGTLPRTSRQEPAEKQKTGDAVVGIGKGRCARRAVCRAGWADAVRGWRAAHSVLATRCLRYARPRQNFALVAKADRPGRSHAAAACGCLRESCLAASGAASAGASALASHGLQHRTVCQGPLEGRFATWPTAKTSTLLPTQELQTFVSSSDDYPDQTSPTFARGVIPSAGICASKLKAQHPSSPLCAKLPDGAPACTDREREAQELGDGVR